MSRRARTARSGLVAAARASLRNEVGNAAVELALVLPFALLLLTGTAQTGYILYVYNNMLHAAQEAARDVAIDASTPAEAKTWVEGRFDWLGDAIAVQVIESGGDTEVSLSVPLATLAVVDPFGIFQSGELDAVATAKGQ